MDSLKYEIVLRVGVDNPTDYFTFEIDGDSSVAEIEKLTVYLLGLFNRIFLVMKRRFDYVP